MSNATAAARKGGRFVVRCDEYTTKPFATEAAARREMDAIVAAGHCHCEHEVVPLSV
jgi:hypothetical protein